MKAEERIEVQNPPNAGGEEKPQSLGKARLCATPLRAILLHW
jgi:hypothetical protein